MTYIKLTLEDGTTRTGMQWAVGVTNRATGGGNTLCSNGVLHVYDTPEQASFMQPAHVPTYTRAWEVRSRCKGVTDGIKRGIKSCTVVREIQLPEITTEQRVEIAIRVSLLVYHEGSYQAWARAWLSGECRAANAAAHAADAAAYAADPGARAAADAAFYAAYAADDAAACAANAAARAPTDAAYAAYEAANAAAHAAAEPIDLLGIIDQVLTAHQEDSNG